MKRFVACLALGAFALRGAGAPLPLISGQPLPIVVSADAGQTERFAADELARYLGKITGRQFTVRAVSGELPEEAVVVGRQLAERLGESFAPERLGDDGILLRRNGRRLLVAGAGARGTLYAVYALLERLGCGFYAPNFAFYGPAGGEHIPHVAAPVVEDLEVAVRPSFRWRMKYLEEGETHDLERLIALVDWMPKVGLNVLSCAIDYQGEGRTKWDNWREGLIPELRKRGILIEVGGHGYQIFLPAARYFAQHPDWFGMDHGKRSEDPRVVFSTANPDAVRAYVEGVRDYLQHHPEIDIFDCRPPDSSHWSTAPEDLALGTPTQRHLLLVNHLAEELKGQFPRLKVRFEAYSALIDPPPRPVRLAENTLMEFCPIDRSFEGPLFADDIPVNHDYFQKLERWTDGVVAPGATILNTYITKYLWRSLPVLIPHLIAQESRRYARMGLGGMASYSEPGAWAALELDHYFLARYLWSASRDPEVELLAYARGRYGAAAAPVLAYLRLVEAVVPHAVLIPGTQLDPKSEQRYLLQFRRGAALLESARQAAAADSGTLALIGKLDGSRRYAENEMQLRQAFMEAAVRWRRDQLTKLQGLLDERRKIIEANRTQGLMVVDARTW